MKAFTLIELLVVVAIIGILAAVGVVAYNGYTKSAKINAAKANHNMSVRSGVEDVQHDDTRAGPHAIFKKSPSFQFDP